MRRRLNGPDEKSEGESDASRIRAKREVRSSSGHKCEGDQVYTDRRRDAWQRLVEDSEEEPTTEFARCVREMRSLCMLYESGLKRRKGRSAKARRALEQDICDPRSFYFVEISHEVEGVDPIPIAVELTGKCEAEPSIESAQMWESGTRQDIRFVTSAFHEDSTGLLHQVAADTTSSLHWRDIEPQQSADSGIQRRERDPDDSVASLRHELEPVLAPDPSLQIFRSMPREIAVACRRHIFVDVIE